MSRQYWKEPIYAWNSNGFNTAVTGTTEAILVPDYTMPPGFLGDQRILETIIYGQFSNIVTTPGTLTINCRLGGVAGTVICTSGAISLSIVAQTNIIFRIHALHRIAISGTGSGGTIYSIGLVELAVQLSTNNNQPNFMGSGGAAFPSGVGIDTTIQQAMTVSAKFSLTGNTISAMSYILYAVN